MNDPWETTNLARNPDYAGTLAELSEALVRCRDQWDDLKHPMGAAFWGRYQESLTPLPASDA